MEKILANKENPTAVAENLVITMDYKLFVDGELYDSSEEEGPIAFLQGHQNIIPGLEKELYGLEIGASKKVRVEPENGYGQPDPEAIMNLPLSELPEEIPVEVGVELELTDEEGELIGATITEVGEDFVLLDFNHPLAGKTLDFEVTIRGLRSASSEEMDHGHIHSH